jgi:CHAT domain-containing protein/tetratricopeptide (TPR) repeat protein
VRLTLSTLLLSLATFTSPALVAAKPQTPSGQSIEVLTKTIADNAAPGREAALANAYRQRGNLLDDQGKFADALADFERYREIAEDIGDRQGVAAALAAVGSVHQVLGNRPLAQDSARAALEIGEELGDAGIMATSHNTLGILSETDGDNRTAVDHYLQALNLRRALGQKSRVARVLLNIGNVYSAQGNYPLSLEQYREALALCHEAGDRSCEATVYITIGNAYGRDGDYTTALEHLERSLGISRELKNEMGIAYATLNIAEAHRLQGKLEESRAAYLDALTRADALGHKGLRAATLLSLAKVLNALGEPAQSLATAQRSITLAAEAGERELLLDAQAIAGQAYRALKQDDKAAASYDEAIANIETMRLNVVGGEEESVRSFETKILPYHAMVELLVDHGRPADALAYAERAKGRVLLDVLHSGRVRVTKAMTAPERETERTLSATVGRLNRDAEHPASAGDAERLRAGLEKARRDYDGFEAGLYAAHPELRGIRGEARAITLADARALLPDARTALLEYVVTEKKTYLFVVTPAADAEPALACFTIDVTRKALTDLAERYRKQLAGRDAGFRASSVRLHDLLLKPAAALLAGRTHLIVVPESVLWNLPFQALQSPAGRYAIQDHAFSYAPSLTVLREMSRARAARPAGDETLLAVGNPATVLTPLPDAETQVRTLSRLYGASRSRVLVGPDAAEDRVKRTAGDYRILQLATHGVFDDASPMHSYVALAQTKAGSTEDGRLEAREIMDLDLRADLVVLSACETARGHIGAGEGVIGLTWAFFVAGSPTTVVSQWQVESSSTTALMLAFHRSRLAMQKTARGPSTALALRDAALGLLNDPAHRHPFYWAGFVVVGDGR